MRYYVCLPRIYKPLVSICIFLIIIIFINDTPRRHGEERERGERERRTEEREREEKVVKIKILALIYTILV